MARGHMGSRDKEGFISHSNAQQMEDPLKAAVKHHWELEPCNTRYAPDATDRVGYLSSLERMRYRLEPYILQLADFDSSKGKRVLEIGVGYGTDFANWIRAGAVATGIDLTERGVS